MQDEEAGLWEKIEFGWKPKKKRKKIAEGTFPPLKGREALWLTDWLVGLLEMRTGDNRL